MSRASEHTSMVELREYSGDFADISDLTRRVWVPQYGGKIWIPIPDPAFLQWKVGSNNGAIRPAAYEGTRLVGNVLSIAQSMRVRGTVYPIALYTGFSVEAEHRRLALPLIERLRRENEARGVAFGIGMVLDDPRSASYRFWTKYAETFPQNFRFVFRGGYWAKFLAPRVLARAGIQAWERMACRGLGAIMSLTPHGYDPHVRPFRRSDLEQCTWMLEGMLEKLEWAQVWSAEQLVQQLESPACRTLVYEREGRLRAMVNYHAFSLLGREPIRAALVDLWADNGSSFAERSRLVSHACNEMRASGIHAVVAARNAIMPAAAFVANLFVPASQHFRIGVFLTRNAPALDAPKNWAFEVT